MHQFEHGQDAAVIFVNKALQESDFYQHFLQGRDLLARVVSICNSFVVSAVSCQKLIAAACLWLSPVLYANQLSGSRRDGTFAALSNDGRWQAHRLRHRNS